MDINITDNKLSTPLHWACYSRAEVALNYILSLNPNLDAKDQKGLTPLHLAVKSVEQLKSTRPVRALLIKGADRMVKDNEGRKPVDYISENLPDVIKRDLKNMLAKPRYLECMMVKTPLVALKPSHKSQVLFWVLCGIIYFSLYFILYPSKYKRQSYKCVIFRSPSLVLCSVIYYDWFESLLTIHYGY